MNLNYIKNYLTAKRDNITPQDIDGLIDEINAYTGVAGSLSDISKIMHVLNEYNVNYIKCVEEYSSIPKGKKNFLARIDKAREILCILSALHTYIVISLTGISENSYDLKNIRKYLTSLSEKKEHFKTEKMAWITILKSLTQEANFYTEMKRLDLEHTFGYLGDGVFKDGERV